MAVALVAEDDAHVAGHTVDISQQPLVNLTESLAHIVGQPSAQTVDGLLFLFLFV